MKFWVCLILSLFSSSIFAAEEASCDKGLLAIAKEYALNLQALQGLAVRDFSEIEMKKITGVKRPFQVVQLHTLGGGERISEKDLFLDDPADLIIGIDVNGNTEGHMYLSVRSDDNKTTRYDGRLFMRPYQLSKKWRISNGLFLRYKTIPDDVRHRILKFWEEGKDNRAWSCVPSGCKILYDVGGFQMPPGPFQFFPSPYLKHLARHGLVDGDGNRLTPQVYSLNRPPEQFWNRLPDVFRMWRFVIPLVLDPKTWGKAQFKP